MSLAIGEYVERLIRRSVVGRNLSRFRRIAPNLYAALREIYGRVFRLRSKYDLARYQIRAMRRFFEVVPNSLLKEGVLEIGSDLDAKVIKELQASGCARVLGINPAFAEADLERINPMLPSGCELRCADMRESGLADASFGALFSVSVFEHLQDFSRCLDEMHRILIPGGVVYAEFGPIWSSSLGHHVFADVDGESARHWDPLRNPLENYSHLLKDEVELRDFLKGKSSDGLAEAIVSWVYRSKDINRLFFDDYIRLIEASPFEVVSMETDREYISAEILLKLQSRYPGYKTFDVRNVEVVLRKRA